MIYNFFVTLDYKFENMEKTAYTLFIITEESYACIHMMIGLHVLIYISR